jgi:hypothetical protein
MRGRVMEKNIAQKAIEGVKKGNERGARVNILEDLFYDFNRSRAQVYKMNFFRGIFFGLGSVIGGTVVVALMLWALGLLVGTPGVGQTVKQFEQTIQNSKK